MRKYIILWMLVTAVIYTSSCARSITPYEAANGKARCGRTLR